MRRQRRSIKLLALIAGLSLIAGACGGDDDDEGAADDTGAAEEGEPTQGGEVIDLGTFVGDPPEHIDPALNSTLDAYQVVNALYDGLTDIDSTDPENPVVVPQVAESFEPNEDATDWTFQIREGLTFSERRAGPAQLVPARLGAGQRPRLRRRLLVPVQLHRGRCREARRRGPRRSPASSADDDAMTLTVTLSAPVLELPDAWPGSRSSSRCRRPSRTIADQTQWDRGMMVGNGPFMLESRAHRHRDRARARTPSGTAPLYTDLDLPEQPYVDRITFQVTADPDTSYNSFEAGEGDTGADPAGPVTRRPRRPTARTLDVNILGSYHWDINMDDPVLGGEESMLLRQAISQAIDRDEINEAVYEGTPHRVERRDAPRASPAAGPTSATTAPTTPRLPRPATRSGWTPATS